MNKSIMLLYIIKNYSFKNLIKISFDLYIWPILAIFNGPEGVYLRRLYIKLFALDAGKNIVFDSNVFLRGSYNLSLGNNILIQPNCHIASQGKLKIGDNSVIGPSTIIVTNDHKFYTDGNNFKKRKFILKEVNIGKNTIIGANCFIHAGVNIGNNCFIGAGSVIYTDIKNNEKISSNYCDKMSNNLKKTIINLKKN